MQTNLIFSTVMWTARRIVGSSRHVVLCVHLSSERIPLALFAPRVLLRCSYIFGISSDVFFSSASSSTAYDSFSIISSVLSLCLAFSGSSRPLLDLAFPFPGCLNSCCNFYSLTLSVCLIFFVSSSMTSYGYLTNLKNLMNRL